MPVASTPRSPIASWARLWRVRSWHPRSCGIEGETVMKLSTDRILTTHVGSLPRPQPLAELLIKKGRNEHYNAAEFAAMAPKAVADIVARRVASDIDVVSGGETRTGG